MGTKCTIFLGLIFNFIGAIILAFSFRAAEDTLIIEDIKEEAGPFTLVRYHKWRFRIAIFLIISGFLLQFIGVVGEIYRTLLFK